MSTHTYAILEISYAAFEEIRASLAKAGYEHQFTKDDDGRLVIDMVGLALAPERVPSPRTINVNGKEMSFTERTIDYPTLVKLAYPDKPFWEYWTAVYFAKLPGGGEINGSLFNGKSITVYDRMSFTVVNTSNA